MGAASAAIFSYSFLHFYIETHRPIGIIFFGQQPLVALAYLIRRPARVVSRRLDDWLLAFGGTFVGVPSLRRRERCPRSPHACTRRSPTGVYARARNLPRSDALASAIIADTVVTAGPAELAPERRVVAVAGHLSAALTAELDAHRGVGSVPPPYRRWQSPAVLNEARWVARLAGRVERFTPAIEPPVL